MADVLLAGKRGQGRTAWLSPEDDDLGEQPWFVGTSGFVIGRVDGRMQPLHRIVMGRLLGRTLESLELVEFADRDALNCRRENLRLTTRQAEALRRGSAGSLDLHGIYPQGRGYWAKRRTPGVVHRLGPFGTPEHAALAYDYLSLTHQGAEAVLNFPGKTPRLPEIETWVLPEGVSAKGVRPPPEKSGFTGVFQNGKGWRARYSGTWGPTRQEAAEAAPDYDRLLMAASGKRKMLNFPGEWPI